MLEQTKVFQFSVQPSLVEKVKAKGNGKFAAGLFFVLGELDRLQGATTKLESVVLAPKGGSKSTRVEDPDHPGESYQQRDKRVREAHANSPDVKREKIRSAIKQYIVGAYHLHRGVINATTMFEQPTYDSKGNHTGYLPEVRIMDYITPEERDAWVLESVAYDKKRKAEDAASRDATKNTQRGPRPTLSADAKYFYQNFPEALANMTDEQIEEANNECAGAIARGDDPIPEHA